MYCLFDLIHKNIDGVRLLWLSGKPTVVLIRGRCGCGGLGLCASYMHPVLAPNNQQMTEAELPQ